MSFFGELKRRRVFTVAAAYLVASWVIIEVSSVIEGPLQLPEWLDTMVIVLLALGFPIALILSWAYDLTPKGIVRTADEQDSPPDEPDKTASEPPPAPAKIIENSIAVLPFENLSPNAEDAYFAAGVHEEIINQLAKIQNLNVIARSSVMQFKDAARHVTDIATELRVGTVMEGTVRYAGERARVSALLVNGETGTQLWSESYDGSLEDFLDIQIEIAREIVRAMNVQLGSGDRALLEEKSFDNPLAYDLYLRARYEHSKFTADSASKSMDFLKKGLRTSPNNQLLNVSLGYAWFNYGSAVLGAEVHDACLEKAEKHALQVLQTNSESGDAKGLLGAVLYDRFETSRGLKLLREGADTQGSNQETLTYASLFHCMSGLTRTAKRWVEELSRVDPLHGSSQWVVGWYHLMKGDLDQAESHVRRAHDLQPDSLMFKIGLGLVLINKGDSAAAREVLASGYSEESKREAWHIIGRVIYHAAGGEKTEALQLIDHDLLQDARSDMLYSWLLADSYAVLDETASALEWLGNATGGGFLHVPFLRKRDRMLVSLHDNEEFQKLLNEAETVMENLRAEAK